MKQLQKERTEANKDEEISSSEAFSKKGVLNNPNLRYLYHIMPYFVTSLGFCPSNSHAEKVLQLYAHMAFGNGSNTV